MIRIITVFLFSMLSFATYSQVFVGGFIKDAESFQAIPYANVILKGESKGVIADVNGEFALEVPNYDKNQVFIFTIIGYETRELTLDELMQSTDVLLKVKPEKIEEVLIKPIDVKNLINRILDSIPKNYYGPPIGQNVFSRFIIVTNNKLAALAESNYHIVNTFNRVRLPKIVSVKKARGYLDLSDIKDFNKFLGKRIKDDSLDMENLGKGLLGFTPNSKAIAEVKRTIFSPNAEKLYNLYYLGVVVKDGKVLHNVGFDQKEHLKKTLFQGNILIDTTSFAIAELYAQLSPQGIEYQKFLPLRFRMLLKLAGYNFEIRQVAIYVKYEENDKGFWSVKEGYTSFNGKVSRRNGKMVDGYIRTTFNVLNNFPRKNFYNINSKYNRIVSDIEPFKKPYFWGGVNIRAMDRDVEPLLKRLLMDN